MNFMTFINLGDTAPLTLGMAHSAPIKDRLMILSHPPRSRIAARLMATALIVTGLIVTAPYTIAKGHPEPELAGKAEDKTQNLTRSRRVIRLSNDDEKNFAAYEIIIKDSDIKAFKLGQDGSKTPYDLNGLENFSMERLTDGQWVFSMDDGNLLKFHKSTGERPQILTFKSGHGVMSKEDLTEWLEGNFAQWKSGEFEEWAQALKDYSAQYAEKGKQGYFILNDEKGSVQFTLPDLPPLPDLSGDIENHFIQSKTLKTESLISAARRLLQDTEDTDDLSLRAQQKLSAARKALKEAEAEISKSRSR